MAMFIKFEENDITYGYLIEIEILCVCFIFVLLTYYRISLHCILMSHMLTNYIDECHTCDIYVKCFVRLVYYVSYVLQVVRATHVKILLERHGSQ